MSEEARNIGIVRVSTDLLAQMFHFPEGHRIIAVRESTDRFGEFDICVEGPSLPLTPFGNITTRVQYQVTVTRNVGDMVPRETFEGKFLA
jgi:hypothetical protein